VTACSSAPTPGCNPYAPSGYKTSSNSGGTWSDAAFPTDFYFRTFVTTAISL